MERILDCLVKKIGLSSNQLLKCVLLNTAIELFSYIDASAYSSLGYLYHDWSMEDFSHLYSASPGTGQILESDTWLPSLPSARTADQSGLNQNPSVAEDIACVTSVDELETMYLPIPENLCVQAGQVNDALGSNNFNILGKSESFYYLVGPVNLWLEFPLAMDTQATPAPESAAAEHSAEEDFHFCFAPPFKTERSFLDIRSKTKDQELVFNNCGVQTTEEPLITSENRTLDNSQRESFSVSFNHETEMKSVFWDSYDLHLSRSPLECTHTNIWEPEDQGLCNIEDLLTLVEEDMFLARQDVENIVYTDLFPVCNVSGETCPPKTTTKSLGEQPVSSTPCEKTRTRSLMLQSKGNVHVLEKQKHKLFD